ncbi:MAG: hypothetical protein PHP85_14715 [Gallionella sp.]|nr:hypothetical protein [Gallionella sp.]
MHEIDLEKSQRGVARWTILRALDAGRPHPVNEDTLLRVLHDIEIPYSMNQLRRDLDYLECCTLVEVSGRKDSPLWMAKLSRHGIDVVEYTVACDAGISRPPKY